MIFLYVFHQVTMTDGIQNHLEVLTPFFAWIAAVAVWKTKIAKGVAEAIAGILLLSALVLLDDPAQLAPVLLYSLFAYAVFIFGSFTSGKNAPPFFRGHFAGYGRAVSCRSSLGFFVIHLHACYGPGDSWWGATQNSDTHLYLAALVALPPVAFFLTRWIFAAFRPASEAV